MRVPATRAAPMSARSVVDERTLSLRPQSDAPRPPTASEVLDTAAETASLAPARSADARRTDARRVGACTLAPDGDRASCRGAPPRGRGRLRPGDPDVDPETTRGCSRRSSTGSTVPRPGGRSPSSTSVPAPAGCQAPILDALPGVRVQLVDVDPDMLDVAAARCPVAHEGRFELRRRAVRGSASPLPRRGRLARPPPRSHPQAEKRELYRSHPPPLEPSGLVVVGDAGGAFRGAGASADVPGLVRAHGCTTASPRNRPTCISPSGREEDVYLSLTRRARGHVERRASPSGLLLA